MHNHDSNKCNDDKNNDNNYDIMIRIRIRMMITTIIIKGITITILMYLTIIM